MYHCFKIFEKLSNAAIEKGIEIKREDVIAKSSEKYITVKTRSLKKT